MIRIDNEGECADLENH